MALKFDGNNNAKGVKWKVGSTTNDVKQVKFDNTIAWCKPVTLTINKISQDYIKYAYITRTATEEPTAGTGVILSSGDFAYHKDTLVASAEAADSWDTWILGAISPLQQFAATQTSVTVYNPNIEGGYFTYTIGTSTQTVTIGALGYATITGLVSNLSLTLDLYINDTGTHHAPQVSLPFMTTTVSASDSDPATMTAEFVGYCTDTPISTIRTATTTVETIAANYLCMTPTSASATSGGTNITLVKDSTTAFPSLQYTVNGKDWFTLAGNSPIFVQYWDANTVQHLYIKGTNSTFSANPGSYHHFTATADFECSGNLMSLLDYSLQTWNTVPSGCFAYLFINNTHIKSVPDMPAYSLGAWCYYGMFSGCTGLLTPSSLGSGESLSVGNGSLEYMFNGCTSLQSCATFYVSDAALADSCFAHMYHGCSSITTTAEFMTELCELADSCCSCMFKGCTSLTTTCNLPVTVAAPYCYSEMFMGCTQLTTINPIAISDGNSASYAFASMFEGCTSLTTAIIPPGSPSYTFFGSYAFASMYQDCTGLTTISGNLGCYSYGSHCCQNMFQGCTSLTTISSDTYFISCGSTSDYCFQGLFKGCTSLTTPALMYFKSGNSTNAQMYRGCTNLYYPFYFPTSSSSFYNDTCAEMFKNCSKIKISTTKTRDYSSPYTILGSQMSSTTNALAYMFNGHTGTWSEHTPSFNTTYYLNCDLKFSATLSNGTGIITSWFGLTNSYSGTQYDSGQMWGYGSELYIYATCSEGYAMWDGYSTSNGWTLVSGNYFETGALYRYGPISIKTNYINSLTPMRAVYVSATCPSGGMSNYYVSVAGPSHYESSKLGARYIPSNASFYIIPIGTIGRPHYQATSVISGTWGESGCVYTGQTSYNSGTDATKTVSITMNYGYLPKITVSGSPSSTYQAYISINGSKTYYTTTGTRTLSSVYSTTAAGLPQVYAGVTAATPSSGINNAYLDTHNYQYNVSHDYILDVKSYASHTLPSSYVSIPARQIELIGSTGAATTGLYCLSAPSISWDGTIPIDITLVNSTKFGGPAYGRIGILFNYYEEIKARNTSVSYTMGVMADAVICSAWYGVADDPNNIATDTCQVSWSNSYTSAVSVWSTDVYNNGYNQVGNRTGCRYLKGKTVYIFAKILTGGYYFDNATLISGTKGEVGSIYLVKTISNISTDTTESISPKQIKYIDMYCSSATTITVNKSGTVSETLQYSLTTGNTWNTILYGTGISVPAGVSLWIRNTKASGNSFSVDTSNYIYFSMSSSATNPVTLSGNLATLLNKYGEATTLPNYAFYHLFYGCSCISAAGSLDFPFTTVGTYACNSMFYDCNKMTSCMYSSYLPKPSSYSYYRMFSGCTSLSSIPYCTWNYTNFDTGGMGYSAVPIHAASQMFYNCSTLYSASKININFLLTEDYSFYNMFLGCSSLVIAPTITVDITHYANYAKIGVHACEGMFSGCSVLTNANETIHLDVKTVSEYGCSQMFYYCSALQHAPELPATTLSSRSYYMMFGSCTSLTVAPDLPATIVPSYCYAYMFSSCTSLVHSPCIAASSLNTDGYNMYYMFSTCTSLCSLPILKPTSLPAYCYYRMFTGDTQLTLTYTTKTANQVAWRVPGSGTGSKQTSSITYMLPTSTGVTLAINTTYYVPAVSVGYGVLTGNADNVYSFEYYGDYNLDDTGIPLICFKSSNAGMNSTYSVAKLTFKQALSSYTIYIRSYAESNYDYTIASTLNAASYPTDYSLSTVKAHTRGNQKSGHTLSDYTDVVYTNIEAGDYIYLVYRKDTSTHTADDAGYVLLPQMQSARYVVKQAIKSMANPTVTIDSSIFAHPKAIITFTPVSTQVAEAWDRKGFGSVMVFRRNINGNLEHNICRRRSGSFATHNTGTGVANLLGERRWSLPTLCWTSETGSARFKVYKPTKAELLAGSITIDLHQYNLFPHGSFSHHGGNFFEHPADNDWTTTLKIGFVYTSGTIVETGTSVRSPANTLTIAKLGECEVRHDYYE